jgi:hypothetical protein
MRRVLHLLEPLGDRVERFCDESLDSFGETRGVSPSIRSPSRSGPAPRDESTPEELVEQPERFAGTHPADVEECLEVGRAVEEGHEKSRAVVELCRAEGVEAHGKCGHEGSCRAEQLGDPPHSRRGSQIDSRPIEDAWAGGRSHVSAV